MKYDAVVIGAGPSGLAAAARMSHFGVSVCLLEAHNRIGGMSSWHHVHGVEVSSGLHAFTNYSASGREGALGKLLRQLRLKGSDLQLRSQSSSSIAFPSATLRFSNDPEYFRNQVSAHFPAQIDGFDRFRNLVRNTDEGELTTKQTSARELMESFITDPLLVDMLFCPVMFYGNPGGVGDGKDAGRSQPDMDWLLFCVVWKCIFESGFGYPSMGMRPLWQTLAERIHQDGSTVRLKSRVTALNTDGNRVVSTTLASGETIEADIFFSSAGGNETDSLTGVAKSQYPIGTISIVEGIKLLDMPPAHLGVTDTTVFYSASDHLHFRRPDQAVSSQSGVICLPYNYIPSDPQENLLKVSVLANYHQWRRLDRAGYTAKKAEVAEILADVSERCGMPVDRGHKSRFGAFDDVFTPVTLERFTSHRQGALYGSPHKSRTGRTDFSNLFLIGADQGFHGIVGAMLSGVAMANMHCLAKRS